MQRIIPDKLSPYEAAAFYAMKILFSSDIVKLAEQWLIQNIDSPKIAILAGESNPIMSEIASMLEAALAEIGINIPDKDKASKIVLKVYLKMIINDEIAPFDGMCAIDNYIYRQYPQNEESGYVGEELGLEYMYTWYRELQDAEDASMLLYYTDLPPEEAVIKFTQHLKEEAEKLFGKLQDY